MGVAWGFHLHLARVNVYPRGFLVDYYPICCQTSCGVVVSGYELSGQKRTHTA